MPAKARPAYDKKIALVLQGGGALGSYQAGVYEALAEAATLPDWVAGISIGAINAAIIAGNAPDQRVAQLRRFWDQVTEPTFPWFTWLEDQVALFGGDRRQVSAAQALLFGQRGFFAPRAATAWLSATGPSSLYDTDILRDTLEAVVDFDRINAGAIRFSVGAVNVRTGNFAYFDNSEITIRPEHVMASAALPPSFPAVEIDGEAYWDGGLISNTPLQHVITSSPRRSTLTFQVDLFPARGPMPETLDEVTERIKDIRYSSRTRAATDTLSQMHDVRHNINTLWNKLPLALRDTPEGRFLYEFGCVTTMDIVQLVYRPKDGAGQPKDRAGRSKDFEFSRRTMQQRWAEGRADAEETLVAAPWLAPMPTHLGARRFDVVQERLRGHA